ncbi:hypothetical protein [Motiliproteus sp. MSK22-1]|uniref:hypothetical protein n=1 Tax=Motiliproteus sp. MSK22-1 TaxID=1897630 RepID=UPI0009753C59|nr:hypothetical protein [Motiliproteus sp. MSK22-1]OMH39482.1 hypothetical protein BGP75_02505 [Motiliproteus sp. MSK22-1]
MQPKDTPLQRIGFQVLLFLFGLVVVSWPLVAQSPPWSLSQLIHFLFLCWVGAIVALFAISRSNARTQKPSPKDSDGATE